MVVADPVKKQMMIKQDALREYNYYLERKKHFEENSMELISKGVDIYNALNISNRISNEKQLKAINPIPMLVERCPR